MSMNRGNGLIVDNIMKPLKGAISAAANKAGRAVARAIGKKALKQQKQRQRRQQQKLKNQVILLGGDSSPKWGLQKPQKLREVEAEGGKLKCHKIK